MEGKDNDAKVKRDRSALVAEIPRRVAGYIDDDDDNHKCLNGCVGYLPKQLNETEIKGKKIDTHTRKRENRRVD